MRILITGGSGFVGRNLAEELTRIYEVSAPSPAERDLVKGRDIRECLRAQHEGLQFDERIKYGVSMPQVVGKAFVMQFPTTGSGALSCYLCPRL
jgi:hypothetical protein